MSPAPANESAVFLSPFFASAAAAAPLSERDCNGTIACPAVSKAPTAACSIRRGASFLDADDACLALSDKTSFLIPEDSYLPGQENFATAPCAPAGLLRAPLRCPSSGAVCPPFPPSHTAFASADVAKSRPRMATPFLLLDAPVFGGEEEFAAASICFEKAVQALEMVERPSGLCDPSDACRPSSTDHRESESTLSSDGWNGDRRHSSVDFSEQRQLTPNQLATRRVSSLAPSPPASDLAGGAGDQFFPGLSYEQAVAAAVSGYAQDGADAAESAAPDYRQSTQPAQEPNAATGAVETINSSVAMFRGSTADTAATNASLDGAVPAAPAPAVRAFHHKTGGPCDHCGATESPQWRRGPPAKPMLCNACGTRFRRTNQLNPAAAISTANRAAAAVAPPVKRSASKRDPPYVATMSSKRGRYSTAH
ncbi:hypothetical protein Vafri_13265 [Volvox africanus]|uniref:GATA-type domain-containing protein n=1 Tax=Volvox africanus TaxID=51714 RepID=A0A8J4F585_9CHLO|nr:hypothetical protein Vafri_13265 [Volvox africanus]